MAQQAWFADPARLLNYRIKNLTLNEELNWDGLTIRRSGVPKSTTCQWQVFDAAGTRLLRLVDDNPSRAAERIAAFILGGERLLAPPVPKPRRPLSVRQLILLRALRRHGAPMPGVPVTFRVVDLIERGYVVQTPDGLIITDAGRTAFEEARRESVF